MFYSKLSQIATYVIDIQLSYNTLNIFYVQLFFEGNMFSPFAIMIALIFLHFYRFISVILSRINLTKFRIN